MLFLVLFNEHDLERLELSNSILLIWNDAHFGDENLKLLELRKRTFLSQKFMKVFFTLSRDNMHGFIQAFEYFL